MDLKGNLGKILLTIPYPGFRILVIPQERDLLTFWGFLYAPFYQCLITDIVENKSDKVSKLHHTMTGKVAKHLHFLVRSSAWLNTWSCRLSVRLSVPVSFIVIEQNHLRNIKELYITHIKADCNDLKAKGTVHILCNHVRGVGGQGPLDDDDYAIREGEG